MQKAKLDDSVLKLVREALNTGQWPSNLSKSDPDVGLLKRESQKLKIEDGLLYRIIHNASGKEVYQLLLPKKFRLPVIRALHDDMGHLGVERTVDLVRDRFYWPKMTQTVERYIGNCRRCVM